MEQTLLDEYVERLDGCVDEAESGEEFMEGYREEASMDVEPQECRYCRLKGSSKKFTLHPGALYLYSKNERLKAIADIDHVYKCERGLKDNIIFLYKMFNDLRSMGFDVVAVGKAFDDELYAYVKDDLKGGRVHITIADEFSSIEEFEKRNWYMLPVDEEIVIEAINEVEKT